MQVNLFSMHDCILALDQVSAGHPMGQCDVYLSPRGILAVSGHQGLVAITGSVVGAVRVS